MKIVIQYKNKKNIYDRESSVCIADLLKQEGYDFAMPCAGTGKCGKCVITAKGELSAVTDTEKRLLAKAAEQDKRLACETFALGDCELEIPDSGEYSGITDFAIDAAHDPVTGNQSLVAGVADIGTTTVAVYAYQMPDGRLLDSRVFKNPQVNVGADVISRLTYAAVNGSDGLCNGVRRGIENAYADMGVSPAFSVVTGNTAMLHFYENLSCTSLAVYPFEPQSLFGELTDKICIPPCISAFVGADITCGILSSGVFKHDRAMLIDIGTNGEIVYKNGAELICCSAAAGPAFEGGGLTNGVPSVPGAINKVYNIGNRFEYTTIGNAKPVGLCGSGLVDAVAAMLRVGVVDETGYLEEDFYIGDSGICITPQDIRAVQTAKSAIRAAIETVCHDLDAVEKFYIAGSFGKFLNIDNAGAIGLLPKNIKNRTVMTGNSAAAGAAMILFDKSRFDEAKTIAEKAKTIQLASNDTFYNNYIRHMNF